ncbi:MAG: hypothetical protein NXH75_11980 [Halobacteriovoraceae bacterium]|nr:hypothetical protein [Halobacteriovoraceae bacterium]
MNWIFKSAGKDATYILGPLFLGSLYCLLVGEYHVAWFGLLVMFIDQTHVASTSWRTIFNKRQSNLINFGVPLCVFAVIGTLVYFKFSYLWTIITYIATIHFIRQNYGVLRWYHKANNYFDPVDEVFFYLFSILPFAIFHFRTDLIFGMFEGGAYFHMPSEDIYQRGMNFYLGLLFLWFFFEVFIRKDFRKCIGSKLFIFGNSLFTYLVLTKLTTVAMIADTFLFAHGLHYLALNLLTIKKISRPKPWVYVAIASMGLALMYLYRTYSSPEDLVNFKVSTETLVFAVLVGIYNLPVLSHYTYDTFIWRSSSVDAEKIYDLRN